jgi:hypothetical protein
MNASEIADEIRGEYESRYGGPRHEAVELGRVKDYLLAMDEPADVGPGDVVPALFVLTLGRTRRPQPSKGSAVNAGDDYEFARSGRSASLAAEGSDHTSAHRGVTTQCHEILSVEV